MLKTNDGMAPKTDPPPISVDASATRWPVPATRIGKAFDPLVPTIFHEPWWLDAASNGSYDEVTVDCGGATVGRFPYDLRRRDAFRRFCGMPELTHYLGPAVDEGRGTAANRAVRRAEITRQLIEKLPSFTGFWHKMHAGVPDVLEFQRAAYRVSVQFTYEIESDSEANLWRKMRDKTRNVIRRAQERFEHCELTDPAEFIRIYNANLRSRGIRNIYPNAAIARLGAAALDRGAGRFLAARDRHGTIAAAIFCVWDARVTYYLMSTRSLDAGNAAVSGLLWAAIRHCAARGLRFDFDGVGEPTAAHFFNGFGAAVAPRYVASRYAPAHVVLDNVEAALTKR